MPHKIVITGPESTGKSTLCEQLAEYYRTVWVKEYAREYLTASGGSYSIDDLIQIAKGQIGIEDKTAAELTDESLLFIDTDMTVIKVWSEFVFNSCPAFILDYIATRFYDLYLLMDTDLPWTEDPLREQQDLTIRRRIFHYYKDMLSSQSIPWAIISGSEEQRFKNAIKVVNSTQFRKQKFKS